MLKIVNELKILKEIAHIQPKGNLQQFNGEIAISDCDVNHIIKSWSPGGSFMDQKMAITSPIPVF